MIRCVVLLTIVCSVVLFAACGQADTAATQLNGAEVTATFEAAKAELLQTRRAEGSQTQTVAALRTPTVPGHEPTTTPVSTATPQAPDATATETAIDPAATVDVMSFFPSDAQLPAGFSIWKDQEVSLEEAVATNADPVAHRQRFADWGFQRLHTRGYQLPQSLTIHDRMNIFFVTVYEWGSPEQAAAAAAFNLEESTDCVCWTNVEYVTIPAIGDEVTGTTAAPVNADGFHNSLIYIRYGAIVVRVEAHATSVDPLPEAVAFVQAAYGSR